MILQSQPSGDDAWLVVTGASSLLALPANEAARAADLSSRLHAPEGFRAALEALVGQGIAGAPSFALLDGDAAVLRVVARGDAVVTAQLADTEVVFSGLGVATWTERVLEGATSVRLTVPGSSWTVSWDANAPTATAHETSAETSAAENTWVPSAPSVPSAGPPPTEPRPRAVPEEPRADPDSEAYDFLFGDTIYRTQAGASIRIPNPDPERPGDHDGQTMLASDLDRPAAQPAALPLAGARVAASDAPSLPLRPTLQLERADGRREALTQPVLIGRSPSASGSASEGGADVRFITIADDPDISRTHLRVAVEGDAVVVTDLGSKNGSIITLPGAAPRKLRASEPTVVLPGTLIDLGGGTTFTVRED